MKAFNKKRCFLNHKYENYIEGIMSFGSNVYFLWKICKNCGKEKYEEINKVQYEKYKKEGIKEKYTIY